MRHFFDEIDECSQCHKPLRWMTMIIDEHFVVLQGNCGNETHDVSTVEMEFVREL